MEEKRDCRSIPCEDRDCCTVPVVPSHYRPHKNKARPGSFLPSLVGWGFIFTLPREIAEKSGSESAPGRFYAMDFPHFQISSFDDEMRVEKREDIFSGPTGFYRARCLPKSLQISLLLQAISIAQTQI